MESPSLAEAVTNAFAVVGRFEPAYKTSKLEKRVREVLRKTATGLPFYSLRCDEIVAQFADEVFETLFMSYSDREWMRHVDLLSVLDVSIKEFFPPDVIANLSQDAFEHVVTDAHDSSFTKHLYLTVLDDIIRKEVDKPKLRRKVYKAVAAGLTQVKEMDFASPGPGPTFDAVTQWAKATLQHLGAEVEEPSSAVPERAALRLFSRFLQEYMRVLGDPKPDPLVYDEASLLKAVQDAYACDGSSNFLNHREPAHGTRVIDLQRMPAHEPSAVRKWEPLDIANRLLIHPIANTESCGFSGQQQQQQPSQSFRNVCVMGAHHCCTNALGLELVRHFAVKLINGELADGRCRPTMPIWKHRIFRELPTLPEDTFCICLVKDPAFWLQSMKRQAPRSFYSVHPIEEHPTAGYVYRYCRAGSGGFDSATIDDILGLVEFDGTVFGDALEIWEATISSYFNPEVYPPSHCVVLRSEDFLFRFNDVVAALAARGLPVRPGRAVQPSPEPAKEHRELRSRGRLEALHFYAEEAERLKDLPPRALKRLAELEAGSLCRALGYGARAVVSWVPGSPGSTPPGEEEEEASDEEPAAKRACSGRWRLRRGAAAPGTPCE